MYEFFIILLNRKTYSSRITDQVYKCTSDIYTKIKYHRGQLVSDNIMLSSLISQSCSLAIGSDATSGILPQVIIYPSSTNDIIDVVMCYNSTYSEYEKIYTLKIHDTLCTIDVKGVDSWVLDRFKVLYEMICQYQTLSAKDNCISIHNSGTLYNINLTLDTMFKAFCTQGNNNVQKIRMSGIDHHLADLSKKMSGTITLLQTQNTVLEEHNTSIGNQNRELKSRLKQVTQEKDKLNAKVVSLSSDKIILEYHIQQLNKKLTTAQDTVQELQSNLSRTNHEFESPNFALRVLSQAITKLRDGVDDTLDTLNVTEALNHLEAKQTNYTNYQGTYERDKKLLDTLLSNAQRDLATCTQEKKKLELELQQKNIELNNTHALLNVSISNIDNINANITQLLVKHNISPRDINNQYNETPDSYVVSLPDDYASAINSTNKSIGSAEVNPYYITAGSIAFGAVPYILLINIVL
ncbi:hypothetical protein [Rickettsia endosymbiont of Polydrusus tereticollis]|uniref:coiled-coil domain-containing protein n=1 Tax=Rickettsia endosymbiont of Polydrusus tereticollis TaxID=3066251 RepID=UPI003132AB79